MRSVFHRALLVSLLLPAVACADGPPGPTAGPVSPVASSMSDSAASYLNAALDIMQQWSVNKHKLNWTEARALVIWRAGSAQTYQDTYGAILVAISMLEDHHSALFAPGTFLGVPGSDPGAMGGLAARRIDGVAGYVAIPPFVGSGQVMLAFGDSIQRLVAATDDGALCGWIVDLRGNTGGNMYPMLAGVGPILGEGDAGFFVDGDGLRRAWYYEQGAVGERPNEYLRLTPPLPYTLVRPMPRVAVLTDAKTASSGEAIAVSFRGRPDTRSFGQPTMGRSSGNRAFVLRDGAVLNLTTSLDADRTGRIYGGVLEPDSLIAAAPGTDAPLDAAVAWVKTAAVCR